MVQELQSLWKKQLATSITTDEEQWKNFKRFYCNKLKEFDKMKAKIEELEEKMDKMNKLTTGLNEQVIQIHDDQNKEKEVDYADVNFKELIISCQETPRAFFDKNGK